MAETPQESRVDLAGRVQRAFDEKRKPPRLTAQETRWVVDGLRASAEGESARVDLAARLEARIIQIAGRRSPLDRSEMIELLGDAASALRASTEGAGVSDEDQAVLRNLVAWLCDGDESCDPGAGVTRRVLTRLAAPPTEQEEARCDASESEQAPMTAKPSGEGDASPPDPDAAQGRSDVPASPSTEQGGTRACESCGETNGHKLDCPTLPGCGCRDDHVSWCPHYNQPAQGSEQEQVRVAKAVKAGEEWALIERLIGLAARCMMQEDVWTCTAAASEIRRLRTSARVRTGESQGQVPAEAIREAIAECEAIDSEHQYHFLCAKLLSRISASGPMHAHSPEELCTIGCPAYDLAEPTRGEGGES